jgi:hypothetical protein
LKKKVEPEHERIFFSKGSGVETGVWVGIKDTCGGEIR